MHSLRLQLDQIRCHALRAAEILLVCAHGGFGDVDRNRELEFFRMKTPIEPAGAAEEADDLWKVISSRMFHRNPDPGR